MKQELVFELLKKIKANPKLKRKVKIFVCVGLVGLLLTFILTIWAGITAFNYVSTKATSVAMSPASQKHVENFKTELKTLPKLQPLNCWDRIHSLIAVRPWLERPVVDNLVNLKLACFEHKPTKCEGDKCVDQ